MQKRKPEIIVFAGPNGSGKSTITDIVGISSDYIYINADEIKKATHCTDLEAAVWAEEKRENALDNNDSFVFETVLSTERNLLLLEKAKDKGYFIKAYFVLTCDPEINISRVEARVESGGHDVPVEKIKKRFTNSINNISELVSIADVVHIIDNSVEPFRIFKKRKDKYFYWENDNWSKGDIEFITDVREWSDYDSWKREKESNNPKNDNR